MHKRFVRIHRKTTHTSQLWSNSPESGEQILSLAGKPGSVRPSSGEDRAGTHKSLGECIKVDSHSGEPDFNREQGSGPGDQGLG